jgi:hypothetical protein
VKKELSQESYSVVLSLRALAETLGHWKWAANETEREAALDQVYDLKDRWSKLRARCSSIFAYTVGASLPCELPFALSSGGRCDRRHCETRMS